MATAPPLKSLRSLDRLGFQMRYLSAYGHELLAGTAIGKLEALLDEESRHVELDSAKFLDRLASGHPLMPAAPSAARQAERSLQSFQTEALRLLAVVADQFGDGSEPGPYQNRDAFHRWAWRRHGRAAGKQAPPPAASRLGLVLCHQALVLQVAAWRAAPDADGWDATRCRAIEEEVHERVLPNMRQLDAVELETGDMISHLLAVLGIRHLVAGHLGRKAAGPPSWEEWLASLTSDVKQTLLKLIARNDLLILAVPQLRRAVEEGRWRPSFEPIRLVERAQATLAGLQRFGGSLVLGRGVPEVRGPLLIGSMARREVRSFASVSSPLLTERESAEFCQALVTELARCEHRLLVTTASPRPAFLDGFFRWARKRFYLARDVDFPLSDLGLHVVMYCYNLLALVASEDQSVREATKQALSWSMVEIAGRRPEIGDVFTIHLALEGLRRSLGALWLEQEGAGWAAVLRRAGPEVTDLIIQLASRSPMARLTVPELEVTLHERRVPWSGLREFLDDSAAELLRDHVAGRIVDEVIAAPELLAGGIRRVLDECLAAETLGGVLMACEFAEGLIRRTFGDLESVAAATGRLRLSDEQLRHMHERARRFKDWYFEPKPADDAAVNVPKALFTLLVELWARKTALDRQQSGPADDRLKRIRQHWRAIALQTTPRLRDRPLFASAQRLLRVFWLNFCAAAFRRCDDPPDGLDEAVPGWDSLARVGCWVAAHLHREVRAHDAGIERLRELEAEGFELEPRDDARAADRGEIESIRRRLEVDVLKNPRFHAALIVRRLRERDAKGGYKWDERRVDEVAAWQI